MLVLRQRRAIKFGWPADLKSQISNLISVVESCSRQLRSWADTLQNSAIPGQRRLTEASRRQFEQKKRAVEFDKLLLQRLPPNHPLRRAAEERESEI